MSNPDRYQLIGRVASTSDPTAVYPVKWDTLTSRLTCPCPKWKFGKGTKHCHHVEAVTDHLQAENLSVADAIQIMRQESVYALGEYLPQADPIQRLFDDFVDTTPLRRRRTYAEFRERVLALGATETRPTTRPDWLGGTRAILLRD